MPAVVSAFGLGQLKLESGLNQPFEARIEMLSATAEELSSLNIGLADVESFQRAGIDRLFILSSLKFEVHETETGPDFIRVFSVDAIREPYLNFLVEAAWSNGRLFREFTVLLDPPLYDPTVRRPVVAEPSVTSPEPVTEAGEVESAPEENVSDAVTTGGYSQGEYGPTGATDTLWSIASTTRADSSISVQQMMIALQRANPEAFTGNNINGLKRGQILRMPDRDEVLSLSQAEAIAEASAQNAMWQESQGLPVTTPTRPVSASTLEDAGDSTSVVESDSSELRLVAAAEAGTGTAGGDAGDAADTVASDTNLTLANEQVEALSHENLELKDRLTEAESIIEDLRRLISLKDDELASLQQQVTESGEPLPDQEQPVEAEVTEEPAVGTDTTAEQPVTETVTEPAAAQDETEVTSSETPAEVKPATVSEPAPAPTPEPGETPQGIVDQILGMVMDNLMIVAAGVGGLFVIIVGFVFFSQRKGRASEATAGPEYEEVAAAAEATVAPGEMPGEVDRDAVTSLPKAVAEAKAEAPAPVERKAAPAPEPTATEEDPLAEVNVFLAYEHFDQAEEFVRDAISGNPDNLDFHTKLLEVFYASGDISKYEEAARVLNEKVNGSGPHWDMTVAMWSEMSPGRALFEAGGAEEQAAPAGRTTAGGGVLDLTAGEESMPGEAGAVDMGLDFDLGDTTDVPAVKKTSPGEEVLDLTAAVGQGEDLLDVTAAVGLEPEPVEGKPGEEEMMLDVNTGSEAPAENLLDISFQSGDNLLDVTAHTDMGTLSGEEDLLDVTAATSAGADADELLEIESAAPVSEKEDNSLDFDIGGIEMPALDVPDGAGEEDSMELDIGGGIELEAPGEDNVIEFDVGDSAKNEDGGLDASIPEEPAGLDFDIGLDNETQGDTSEPSLELDTGDHEESGIEFDLTSNEDAADGGLDLGLELADDVEAKSELDIAIDEDDKDDHTVFVPRSVDTQQQSAEDEIATKLDLAKAYVELGDKDSARGMLEEIIQEGNPQQKATAKELLQQVK